MDMVGREKEGGSMRSEKDEASGGLVWSSIGITCWRSLWMMSMDIRGSFVVVGRDVPL